MYTLAYINRNMDLHFMEVQDENVCFPIPEDLIIVGVLQGNKAIFEPEEKLDLTNVERLIIGLRGSFDLSFVKFGDFRKQNSQMCPFIPPLPTLEITNMTTNKIEWVFAFPVSVEYLISGTPEDGVWGDYDNELHVNILNLSPADENLNDWYRLKYGEIYSVPVNHPLPA
jgi:hypothetical protein